MPCMTSARARVFYGYIVHKAEVEVIAASAMYPRRTLAAR
jgi:hypothetical protein